jgi:uncharacterized hydantoinase/oxoprolinase family protein
VASEYFAISGDVHLALGRLDAADYSCPTPDGRQATPDAALSRLARVVCADSEQLEPAEILAIARFVAERQTLQIVAGLTQVLARLGGRRDVPALALGLGAFLAEDAARRLGLEVCDAAQALGRDASIGAPSWAAAQLLALHLEKEPPADGAV